jgi:hypothetical protein
MTEGTSAKQKICTAAARGRSESDPATAENYEKRAGNLQRGERKKHRAVAVGDPQRGGATSGVVRHGIENMDLHLRWQLPSQGTRE